jgi:hypothetical protein
MFRLAYKDKMSKQRRRIVTMLLFIIPLLALINGFFWLLDWVFFPRLWFKAKDPKPPIFIIGHARSGTTLMHRLLTGDSERFSYFMTYEMFFPSLSLRKIIRLLATIDKKFFKEKFNHKRLAWEDKVFAKGREMHPMSLTGPEEDDFIHALSCASGFWVMLFPYFKELEKDFYYIDQQPLLQRGKLMQFYRQCVNRQLLLNGRHKHHCSKNPTFSGRVQSLIDEFPDAKFIVMYRNPLETMPSLLKLMQRNWKASDCQAERIEDSLRRLGQQSIHTYQYPLEVLGNNPNTQFSVIDYRELIEKPKAIVEKIYQEFGMTITDSFQQKLNDEEEKSAHHRAEHIYNLKEFGLSYVDIRSHLSDLFDRFKWSTPVTTNKYVKENIQNESPR